MAVIQFLASIFSNCTIVSYKIPYRSPSPGGRELEGEGFHPHLNPLPSRARNFRRDYVVNYTYASCAAQSVVKSQETVWEKSASKKVSEDHA